jgi:hypothetical protein
MCKAVSYGYLERFLSKPSPASGEGSDSPVLSLSAARHEAVERGCQTGAAIAGGRREP